MRSLIFHLIIIPGVFFLGWLLGSIKFTGFHTVNVRSRSKEGAK